MGVGVYKTSIQFHRQNLNHTFCLFIKNNFFLFLFIKDNFYFHNSFSKQCHTNVLLLIVKFIN